MPRSRPQFDAFTVRLVGLANGEFAASLATLPPNGAAFRISFRERGRAAFATPNGVVALPPGRAVLIAKDMDRGCRPEGDASHLLVEFQLDGRRSAGALPLDSGHVVLPAEPRRDSLARELLQELAPGARPGLGHAARAHAFVQLCLSSLLDLAPDAGDGRASALHARNQLQAALRYIDSHLAELLPNSKLAELSHASESHFIRLFRRTLGCTPARHVQERRVSSAAELLIRTNLSIDEIAERCGFANRYHFSRVFAQRMANPPARFRTLHTNEARLPSRPGDTPLYGSF